MTVFILPGTVCTAVIALSVVTDLATRRIPNWITMTAVAGGLVYHCYHLGTWDGLACAAGGCALGGGMLLPLFMAGGMGGGDVKLMGALGAWNGPAGALNIFIYAALAGALWAVAVLVRQRALRGTLRSIRYAFFHLAVAGHWPGIPMTGARLPYAVVLGLGYIGYRINGILV